jgi:hypothetical protein
VDDFPHNDTGDVVGIAADAAGDVYVAGMGWTIRKGVSGTSFSTVDVVPGGRVNAIFAHPTWGVFAVGSRYINNVAAWTVRRSLDGGATWTTVDTFQLQSGLNSTPLGMGADANRNLYVVGRGDTSPKRNTVCRHWLVRKSNDGGNSWSTVDDFLPGGSVEARGFAANANGDLYVAGITTSSTGYCWIVRKSAGGTGVWTTIDNYQYASGRTEPHAIAADASGNVFVGGAGYDNLGGHWIVKKY